MKLEERTCACGCGKTFRCLETSKTRYSSLHCMELAGALPPVEKFGRGAKAARPAGATAAKDPEGAEDLEEAEDAEIADAPLLMEEDEEGLEAEPIEEPGTRTPPDLDPTL